MKDNAKAKALRVEGNDFYRKKKFYEALISYNKSLCFATTKSQEMAKTYANRSAVYLELNEFNRCLENIELAKENYYKDFKKLEERSKKCLTKMQQLTKEPIKDPFLFFKLSYPANENVSFIVDCLKISEDERFCRGIVATRDLNPGDVIVIEESCFKAIDENAHYSRCANCLRSNTLNLMPCPDFCSFSERIS